MEIYQPFMFVGLGGTGGKVGAELELWLRRHLRGADGETPIGGDTRRYLAYELPGCFQFVYADLDEREAYELRRQSAPPSTPPGEHDRAIYRTAHVATNLVPVQRSYPDVAQSLRIAAEREVRDWLPPADGEPNIAPLTLGAGQLPTIARACLFETMATSGGVEVAQRPIKAAINALGGSADELAAIGGAKSNACDVFVVFSVAGGTGTGIFYDYMHLIADAFKGSGIEILIHPLVVMPSAFPAGQGGGRPAMLNAGRGLLDLARLIDDQNTRGADKRFRAADSQRELGLSVAYPKHSAIRIEPSIIQTAYLFSETTGISPADLRRSIVSFILAMAGVRNRSGGGGVEGPGVAQNFFINRGVARQSLAPSGVGSRSMSEAAVTSLSVPRGEMLDILAAHLLSLVVKAADERGQASENNDALIRQFMAATGLGDLLNLPNVARARGQQLAAGASRAQAMRTEVQHLSVILSDSVPRMAREFDPWKGLKALLSSPVPGQDQVDLFRAERVVFGRGQGGGPSQGSAASSVTVEYLLHDRATFANVPDDPPPDDQQAAQDQWLENKVDATWHQAWADQRSEWEPKLVRFRVVLRSLTAALRRQRLDEDGVFAARVADLFAERKVAPYFLPDLPRNPDEFYRRLATRLNRALQTNEDATSMFAALLERDIWEKVVADGDEYDAEHAAANLRRRIDDAIWSWTQNGAMVVPRLADLLNAAAGLPVDVPDADRDRFRDKLKGLIPPGLLPQAAGDTKILVSYPVGSTDRDPAAPATLITALTATSGAAAAMATPLATEGAAASANGSGSGSAETRVLATSNLEVEAYLRKSLDSQIGRQPGAVDYEFSPTREESLTVVLIRTALGVTDVPEVRDVMNFWSAALRNQQEDDYLKWRQRTGHHYDWLLTTEQQRINILQRLMIAMRNGQVDILTGTAQRPGEITFRVSADSTDDVARLQLRLVPFGPTSPWGSLLHAYEESTLGGDELNRQRMYLSLLNVRPIATVAEDGATSEGGPVYKEFRRTAEDECNRLRGLRDELRKQNQGKPSSTRLRRIESLLEFWCKTAPAAWSKEFAVPIDAGASLKELDEGWVGLTKGYMSGSWT